MSDLSAGVSPLSEQPRTVSDALIAAVAASPSTDDATLPPESESTKALPLSFTPACDPIASPLPPLPPALPSPHDTAHHHAANASSSRGHPSHSHSHSHLHSQALSSAAKASLYARIMPYGWHEFKHPRLAHEAGLMSLTRPEAYSEQRSSQLPSPPPPATATATRATPNATQDHPSGDTSSATSSTSAGSSGSGFYRTLLSRSKQSPSKLAFLCTALALFVAAFARRAWAYLTSPTGKNVIKSTVAFSASSLLFLVPNSVNYLAPGSVLPTIGLALLSIHGSVGAAIDELFLSLLGLVVGSIFILIQALISPTNIFVIVMGIFVVIYILSFARAQWPRLYLSSMTAKIIYILILFNIYRNEISGISEPPYRVPWHFVGNLALGSAIAFVGCVLLWPTFATHVFHREVAATLQAISKLMATNIHAFLLQNNLPGSLPAGTEPLAETAPVDSAIDASQLCFPTLEEIEARYKSSSALVRTIIQSCTKLSGLLHAVSIEQSIGLSRLGTPVKIVTKLRIISQLVSTMSENVKFQDTVYQEYKEERLEALASLTPVIVPLLGYCQSVSNSLQESFSKSTIVAPSVGNILVHLEPLDKCTTTLAKLVDRATAVPPSPNPEATAQRHFPSRFESFITHPHALPSHAPTSPKDYSMQDVVMERVFLITTFLFALRGLAVELQLLSDGLVAEGKNRKFTFPLSLLPLDYWASVIASVRAKSHLSYARRALYRMEDCLTSLPSQFAFRTGIGCAFLSFLSINVIGPSWSAWRGDWAVVSVAIIMLPSVGASYVHGLWRIIGTLIAAGWACVCWYSTGNSIIGEIALLIPFIFVMYHVRLVKVYLINPKFGFITMITYVIILGGILERSVLGDPLDTPYWAIPAARVAAISLGVVVVMLLSRFLLPYHARKGVRVILSQCLQNFEKLLGMEFSVLALGSELADLLLYNVTTTTSIPTDYHMLLHHLHPYISVGTDGAKSDSEPSERSDMDAHPHPHDEAENDSSAVDDTRDGQSLGATATPHRSPHHVVSFNVLEPSEEHAQTPPSAHLYRLRALSTARLTGSRNGSISVSRPTLLASRSSTDMLPTAGSRPSRRRHLKALLQVKLSAFLNDADVHRLPSTSKHLSLHDMLDSKMIALQVDIDSLIVSSETLLEMAAVEPSIHGRFPRELYQEFIVTTRKLLDHMDAIRMATCYGFSPAFRRAIILPLNPLRKVVIGSILTLMTLLVSSLKSKVPLPHYLPNPKECRRRLVNVLAQLLAQSGPIVRSNELSFVRFGVFGIHLYYISEDLEKMCHIVRQLYGENTMIAGCFSWIDYQIHDLLKEEGSLHAKEADMVRTSVSCTQETDV